MAPSRLAALAAGLTVLAAPAAARIHHLEIKNDPRFAFSIESFGFLSGGEMSINVRDLKATPAGEAHRMGFVLFPAQSESNVAADIDTLVSKDSCALDFAESSTQIYAIDLSDESKWAATSEKLQVEGGGMFDLMFTHCSPESSDYRVSFTLDYTFNNPGPNYLSAGEMPLPWVYGVLTMLFAGATGVWLWHMRRNKPDVQKIHYLMTLLVVTKTLSLLFESVMYHFIALTGHSTGWNIVFYILTFARGCLLVIVIALIGAGWSLLKPFLTDREKKVLMVILPLQILNNIAIIVVDEMAPGSMAYSAWVNVLHVADIIAAAAILFPIVWSIKHLRDAQAADRGDEKAKDTLIRLTQFRTFYMLTLAWLYFTRIVVYLIAASIAWDRQWLAPLVAELATVGYYAWTGYRFRPAPDNSDYLRVPQDDDGPADGARGVEMTAQGGGAIDDDDEEAGQTGRTTAASVRVKAGPTQSVAKAAVDKEAVDFASAAAAAGAAGEGAGAQPTATASPAAAAATSSKTAAAGSKGSKAIAIADDDDDLEGGEGEGDFGLDADDLEFDLGVRPAGGVASSSAAAGGSAGGGSKMKNLRASKEQD